MSERDLPSSSGGCDLRGPSSGGCDLRGPSSGGCEIEPRESGREKRREKDKINNNIIILKSRLYYRL